MAAHTWIPVAAWIAAAAVMLVVLGFCAYEILWKTKRLRADLARLDTTSAQLDELRDAVATARQRLATTGSR